MAKEGISYEGAFDQALRALLTSPWKTIAPDEVERSCDWLAGLRLPEIGLRVRNAPRAQHPRVVRGLALRAYAERFGDPRHGHELALRAVEVAEALPYAAEHMSLARDLQAGALGVLANSFRLLEDHQEAEETWKRCEERRAGGTDDLHLGGELGRLKAALRRDQRRYAEAIELQQGAACVLEGIAELHAAGKTWLSLAVTYFDAGDPGAAVEAASDAGRLLDCEREPELGFALLHNTLFFLEALKQPRLTTILLHKLEPLYAEAGSPIFVWRCWWLKGRLIAATGRHRPAAKHFDAARKAFVEHNLPYDAALAGFDAAHAYSRLGQPLRVKHIAEQMFEVFTSKAIPVEAAAAFKIFVDAALAWEADETLMARVAENLERVRFPGLEQRR